MSRLLAGARRRLGPHLPDPVRAQLGRIRRVAGRRRGARETWERSLVNELDWWAHWLSGADTGGSRPSDRLAWRLDPGTTVEPPLMEVIERLPGAVVRILDVGAGPLTSVGKLHPLKELDLVAVDPLAADYDRLLDDARIDPPIRTLHGEAERLVERFRSASFDIAYADNALDHSADPLAGIKAMLGVVRPGGFVVLRHAANEGERNHYLGLHQWNFDVDGSRLVLWNRRVRHDVGQHLGGVASLDCRREGPLVICVIEKAARA